MVYYYIYTRDFPFVPYRYTIYVKKRSFIMYAIKVKSDKDCIKGVCKFIKGFSTFFFHFLVKYESFIAEFLKSLF